jgi:hypothetical protein
VYDDLTPSSVIATAHKIDTITSAEQVNGKINPSKKRRPPRYTTVPTKLPTDAVNPIAAASQNVTRINDFNISAPPA